MAKDPEGSARAPLLFWGDLRSVALFRVGLALLLLCNLASRMCDAGAFYADTGLLSRAALIELAGPWLFSVHLGTGAAAVIAIIFAAQVALAFMLLAGAHARLAAFASFVLLGSLNARNPFVLLPGDSFTVALLFWGSLLPLGACWARDAARAGTATAAPGPFAWRGWSLAGLLVHALIALGFARHAGAPVAFAPWVVAALVLVPAAAWESLRRLTDHGRRLRIYHDGDCEPCRIGCERLVHWLALPRTEIAPAQDQARMRALMESRNSWVIVDASDVAHTKWRGFVAMLRHSPLFGWLAPLAGLTVWDAPGDALYDLLARRRKDSPLAEIRPWTRLLPSRRGNGFALVALALLLVWTLARTGSMPAPTARPLLAGFTLANLDVTAGNDPVPVRALLPVGRTTEGREVNVLAPDLPEFTASGEQSSARWRAWQGRAASRENLQQLSSAYACRGAETPLESVRFVDLVPRTDASGDEQQVLWRNTCVR